MKHNKVIPVLNNMGKNIAVAASFPLGYAWLPISCCFVLPTVRYGMEEPEPAGAMEKFSLNFAGIMIGFFSTISGACCLGCCGTRSPKEIYN